MASQDGRRVAITGAAGQLGSQLVRAFADGGDTVLRLARPEFDITDTDHLRTLTAWGPAVVINAAAWTDVDGCARDPQRGMLVNGRSAGAVATAAAAAGASIVQVSTNEVFAGDRDRPYETDDATGPVNSYGASKLAGEQAVAAANPDHLIVRTAWLFGPGGSNFVTKILRAAGKALERGEGLRLVADEWGNPTWTSDLADRLRALVLGGRRGIVHLAGDPPTTRAEWALLALEAARLDVEVIRISADEFERASVPPRHAVLAVEPGVAIDWQRRTREYAEAVLSVAKA
jgi:dTDP-4-dehydrorhamnose reductase